MYRTRFYVHVWQASLDNEPWYGTETFVLVTDSMYNHGAAFVLRDGYASQSCCVTGIAIPAAAIGPVAS